MKRLAILGSTGSIGTQTLEIVSRHPDMFEVEVITAYNNLELLAQQARLYKPASVVIGNERHYHTLRNMLSDLPIKVFAGESAIEQVAEQSNIDIVVAAMVGYSGLRHVVAAIKAGRTVALANKETLVVGGHIISSLSRKHGGKVIPVDSEHSAIMQCLVGESFDAIEKITLTASGGPFRDFSPEQMLSVTPEMALKHPNWQMGCKVTIDSASMMNKGLEVIEASWLFELSPNEIEVVIHPQSIVHSLVHFRDGSIKAQLGLPDMRLPIIYALGFPERVETSLPRFDFADYETLTFRKVDETQFPNLVLAYGVLREGGNMPCLMNAANEVAVDAFLKGQTGFIQMTGIIEEVLSKEEKISTPSLEELEESDRRARVLAKNIVNKTVKQ